MASSSLGTLLRHLTGWAERPALMEFSDAQLLERFVTHREEAAFAGLLRRHGPMVLSVCRRALANEQDREDVFQATFLLLARKAGSIRKRESVASWLHGVAHRLAVRCDAQNIRRRAHERQAAQQRDAATTAPEAWEELRALLDEAIAELPEKYRTALVLCYLEDHTHEAAARRLGCRLTTLRSRLARGRERLRATLVRHGLTLSSASLLAVMATSAAQAALPASLRIRTLTAALPFAKGEAVSALVSTSTAALVEGGLQAMSTVKLKVFLVLLLTAGLTLGGAGLLAHQIFGAKNPAEPPRSSGERAAAPPPENKAKPAVDRFGDPLPERAIARLGTVRLRHSGCVYAVAFSPDGRLLASASSQGEVRLWDAATGKQLGALVDPLGGLTQCLAFSPNGKLLASDKGGQTIWNVATGKKLRRLEAKHAGHATCMNFAPDGRSLVVGTDADGTIWFHDPATGKVIRRLEGHTQAITAMAFSQDGKLLASASEDKTVRIWDVSSGKVLHTFTFLTEILHIALSPDGQFLAIRSVNAYLFEIATEKEVSGFLADGGAGSLAFSPDSTILASVRDLRDGRTGKKLRVLENAWGHCVAFSPNGKTVAVGGLGGVVSLYDAATGKELSQSRAGPNRGPAFLVRFGYDGKTLAMGSSGVFLWDVATQRIRCRASEQHHNALAISPDGKALALVEMYGAVLLLDAATGRELRRMQGKVVGDYQAYGLAFSADGKFLTTAGYSDTIRLWETATGKEVRRFKGLKTTVYSLAFSRDGKTLVSTSNDDILRLWDVASGEERRRQEGWPSVRALSDDGQWCVVGSRVHSDQPEMLHVCATATGKIACRLEKVDGYQLCVFSPDSRCIIVGAGERSAPEKGRTILLLERATGRERARFTGHLGLIKNAAISPDGRMLASVSYDTTGLIWDVTGRMQDGRLKEASFSPKELDSLWVDLAGSDAEKAFRAVWALIAAAKQTVPLLRERLRPQPAADGKQIARWIDDLDSAEFKVRERARDGLENLGELAEPALRQAVANATSLEVRLRLRQLLDKLDSAPLAPKRLQEVRAVEVLEHIGTPDARRLLASLAEGTPQTRLTREAKAALERLR